MHRRTFVGAGSAAALGALAGLPAWAETKIGGDVHFYCGFAPGGTADLLCRILADAVTPEVGQKVIVDTKTGASGFIANETVANSPPDGRTIGLAAMAAMCVAPVMPGQKLPINECDTDLTPIASIAGVYNMLVFGKHRAVPHRARADRAGEEEPGQVLLRLGRQRHVAASTRASCSRRWRASISCTCPIAAARRPSRTWSRVIAT